jgi:HSP20 family protein
MKKEDMVMTNRGFRWFDPWREFSELFEDEFLSTRSRGFPAVNYYTYKDDAVVTAEMPGVDSEDIDVSVEGSTLTIRGKRSENSLGQEESYHRRERWHGAFRRTMELPFGVEGGKVEAAYRNGVLTVSLPRAEAEKPRKISITNS